MDAVVQDEGALGPGLLMGGREDPSGFPMGGPLGCVQFRLMGGALSWLEIIKIGLELRLGM